MRSRIKRWRQGTNGRPFRPLPIHTREPEDGEQTLRLVTLNVAHGRRLAPHQALLSESVVRRNLYEIAALLSGADADIVALQEADGPSAWSGNFDHVETLAGLVEHDHHYRGEHSPFAIVSANLSYGTALMSRIELQTARSHRFGTNWRDAKGFVIATVEVPQWDGLRVDIISLHLEPFLPRTRGKQIAQLVDEVGGRDRPLVVMGDFNCSWSEEARHFRPLVEHLRLRPFQPYRRAPTFPSRRPFRRLDWILLSPELEYAGYRNLPNPVSDHLGVVAEIRRSEVTLEAQSETELAV